MPEGQLHLLQRASELLQGSGFAPGMASTVEAEPPVLGPLRQQLDAESSYCWHGELSLQDCSVAADRHGELSRGVKYGDLPSEDR
jgi:hypothetical protein